MAKNTTGLADRYAVALYDLAEEKGALDAVASDLKQLAALLGEVADLKALIQSPLFKRAEQGAALEAVLGKAGAHDLTRRFVGVLAANRRLVALPDVIKAFLARLAGKRGEVVAEVTSAAPLTDAQVKAVTETLKAALGGKVLVDLKTDASLIGGLVVRVGSKLIDNSLKTKLMRLQLAMKGVG